MQFSHKQLLAVLALSHASEAFQMPAQKAQAGLVGLPSPTCPFGSSSVCLGQINPDNNESPAETPRRGLRNIISKLKKPVAFLALATSVALVAAPEQAHASAPVMAMPKADVRDPALDALENHQRAMQQQAQDELRQYNLKARQIEAAEGPAARVKFEQDFKEGQEKLAQERLDKIEKLKRGLLDQGICPFIDIEGQRQVIEAEKGVDLGAVAGTPFYVEKMYENKSPQKTYAFKKQANREMIKCMVEDMKNRDIDALEYFDKHQLKTTNILELPAAQAASLATKYRENLDLYGQVSVPQEGEMSAKEKMAKGGKSSASQDQAKRLKAEAKAKAAEEKAATKAKAKEEKELAKAEAKAAKDAAKQEKEAAKAAAAAALIASTAATADSIATVVDTVEATPEPESLTESSPAAVEAAGTAKSVTEKKSSKSLRIVPAAAVLVAVGGGGYALKMVKDKSAADEEERQRQFQLLMGGLEDEDESSAPSSAPALEVVDTDLSDMIFEEEQPGQVLDEPAVVEKAPKKKKKRGFFGKKKNGRETDINALVSAGSKAPEFGTVLAKILTFGAPGRFPDVVSLSGEMPLQEFDLETASAKLVEGQEAASLSREEAAEVFANVVNCMLIDIVDLASTSLKEKDTKVMVDAISIVVDFMNHAASLYNSIAEGVVITPVTYGGDLSKGKLEQMYSAYAVSGMSNMANMDEDFDNRVSLLQDVFQINEKKAEGLMMKAMQKNMMEMMKSGEGMEGMEDMMKGMGMDDMEGMGGLPGMDGEEPSPEQLKEMLMALKQLKDSGSIPPAELEEVKKQFKESFGSSIDDVMKDADATDGDLASQDKELLELMKSILD